MTEKLHTIDFSVPDLLVSGKVNGFTLSNRVSKTLLKEK
jgi:hypothetical protein